MKRRSALVLGAALALGPGWTHTSGAVSDGPFTLERPAESPGSPDMTENKRTVAKYMDGFRTSAHGLVLSYLTDDIDWEIPGVFHLTGKEAFDKEIGGDAFVGSSAITITRMTEEHDVVVAEGSVRVQKKAGGFLNAVFCDVFVMQRGKIKRLTSYLVEVK
jgi:uncharacterized protein